ncbi:hypothetical protein GALMADRAFT_146997 [Galerina marginata CBS 339.88]|uniref:Uncharacterized protein n=1 Tax=Galerina marginata (strain CBS 339.88) TaxID=685588 RepID=A0A067S9Z9_GALM3|nr:hypothetical protein GALMADRAFT_146997 [Galerina marginata CBS 339.88]
MPQPARPYTLSDVHLARLGLLSQPTPHARRAASQRGRENRRGRISALLLLDWDNDRLMGMATEAEADMGSNNITLYFHTSAIPSGAGASGKLEAKLKLKLEEDNVVAAGAAITHADTAKTPSAEDAVLSFSLSKARNALATSIDATQSAFSIPKAIPPPSSLFAKPDHRVGPPQMPKLLPCLPPCLLLVRYRRRYRLRRSQGGPLLQPPHRRKGSSANINSRANTSMNTNTNTNTNTNASTRCSSPNPRLHRSNVDLNMHMPVLFEKQAPAPHA